ncbi:bifunctional DNA primase/polymerase [Thermodesulfobacteriota bacterium]
MQNNENNNKPKKPETVVTETETTIENKETARERARRRWKPGLSHEQITRYINRSIQWDIRWKRPLIRAAALRYAKLGFSVIPIDPRTKRPLVKWKPYQEKSPTPDEVRAWWKQFPDAQIAILTGKNSDLVAVDFDSSQAKKNFEEIFGELPNTLRQSTGRGFHVLFKNNSKLRTRIGVIEGLDLKAEKGYFVVAPSIHPSGKHYEWQNFNIFSDGLDNLLDMSAEMVDFFVADHKKVKDSRVEMGYAPVPEGERNTRLTQLIGRWIKKRVPAEELYLMAFGWNSTLEKPLGENEVKRTVESIIRTDMRNNPDRYENKTPSARIKIFTASELINSEFPDPNWAIPGILPEGLNILAGKPKVGKSIFALNVGIAVARGTKAFDSIDVEKGSVIYLALEDTPKRLQKRLKKLVPQGRAWIETGNLLIVTHWPRMGEGGIGLLEEEIEKHSDLRLVMIDTLAKFRPPPRDRSGNPYEFDYYHVSQIKRLADEHSISILVIHHLRKTDAEDVFDTFSGTFGLTGAADGLLALIKKGDQSELHLTGRDIENAEYALELIPHDMRWKYLGKSDEIQSSQAKQRVYDVLKDSGGELAVGEIVDLTGMKNIYVKKAVSKLTQEGRITRVRRGTYTI